MAARAACNSFDDIEVITTRSTMPVRRIAVASREKVVIVQFGACFSSSITRPLCRWAVWR